jgi:uncharacterized membrane protein
MHGQQNIKKGIFVLGENIFFRQSFLFFKNTSLMNHHAHLTTRQILLYSIDQVIQLILRDLLIYWMQVISLTFMGPCMFNVFLSTTNKMQRHTIFFIVVSGLHVSGGFFAHHQELKNCTCSIGYLSHQTSLTSIRCCMYSFWAPDDERKTARNM